MSTQTLSGSRPGVGSAVVQDEAIARTVNVAGVGVVQTESGTPTPPAGGADQARVMVLA
jgi:hypothetical protein